MTAWRLAALALAAVVAGTIVGLVVVDRGGERPLPARHERTMTISTSVKPRAHLFGDPVVAAVDLRFDRRRVAPDRVSIDALFRPYEQTGPPRVERSTVGDTVRMRFSYPLRCLARACVPTDAQREVVFPPLRVVYSLTEVRARANDIAEWPPVTIASRLGPSDVQEARWRADLEPASVAYRASPGWIAAGLIGSSALLVLAAGLVGAWLLVPRRRLADEPVAVDTRSPLTRALDVVDRTSANGATPEQRQALELLARELERADEPALAARARRLAWSPGHPVRGDVDELAADVRGSLGDGEV